MTKIIDIHLPLSFINKRENIKGGIYLRQNSNVI